MKSYMSHRRTTWPELIPGFGSVKQLRVLLLSPGRDASSSQDYNQEHVTGVVVSSKRSNA